MCPNDANFTFTLPVGEYPIVRLHRRRGGWDRKLAGVFAVAEKHQIGVFLDFCNACGNCDVFCPEDGGPYAVKPHFFGSQAAWQASASIDGFYVHGHQEAFTLLARIEGQTFRLVMDGPVAAFDGPGFGIRLDVGAPAATVQGEADEGTDRRSRQTDPVHAVGAGSALVGPDQLCQLPRAAPARARRMKAAPISS